MVGYLIVGCRAAMPWSWLGSRTFKPNLESYGACIYVNFGKQKLILYLRGLDPLNATW